MVNSSQQPAHFSISFYDNTGRSVVLPLSGSSGVSTIDGQVAGNGTSYYELGNQETNLIGGSAVVLSDPSITVQVLFRRHGSDNSFYEAAVPSTTGYNEFSIPFDMTIFLATGSQIYTGIAIANLDNTVNANVLCTARDAGGTIIPNAIVVPVLNPAGHWADYLFPALMGKRGTIDCTSNTKVGSIALRVLGTNAVSSLPVISLR